MRISQAVPVEAGQKFEIDAFRPEDAPGIANLYCSVYGPDYPIDTFYIPEKLTAENRSGNIYSVVARTPKGDIIGHGALYRSSAEYPFLYEGGQYLVLKDYRNSTAAFKINQYVGKVLPECNHISGLYGEEVCNHVITQKMAARLNLKDTALEIGLMPAHMFEAEEAATGRVSCILQFKIYEDRPHKIYIPSCYRTEMEFIFGDTELKREFTISSEDIPGDSVSMIKIKYFDVAAVGRFSISSPGADFESRVAEIEKEASGKNIEVLQFYLNLDNPWIGKCVDILRDKGYFLGGYLPRWFDSDGLLMQKLLVTPEFDSIKLYTEKAGKLLQYVMKDWEQTQKQ